MLGSLVIISAIVFAIILPVMVLIKHYHPSELSTSKNIFWIIVTFITWPAVPLIMATRRRDKILLSLFWGSFIVMAVATWYWSVLNVAKLLEFQQYLTATQQPPTL